jgi:YesN/AraC family two-component response regulator
VEQRQSCLHATLGPEVSAYVQAHHADPNLSIKMVGAAFHLTPAYLSRLYREQTGESLPDYINRIRLDKVKERLANGQDSIHHIAEITGFTNSNSLIRTFKKYEGITPGQYKANLRK